MNALAEVLKTQIKQHIHDEYLQAKIFPKIVYYQCIAEGERADWNMFLQNCNEAIAQIFYMEGELNK